MAIDERYPDIMYAATIYVGSSYKFFRTRDGGATAWENISDLVPTCCNWNALEVSPVTGDVIVSTSNGTFIIPPPYPQEETLFSALGQESYLQNSPWEDSTATFPEKNNNTKKKIPVFPNPTQGPVKIDLKEVCKKVELEICDFNGRIIQKEEYAGKQIISINLGGPSGIYVLNIQTESFKSSVKVVKN
jgi:hypothetical protein